MEDAPSTARALLAKSAKLRLFLMLRQTVDGARLAQNLGDHLVWIIEQEKRGKVFLSGPVASHEGEIRLDGLTVFRAADETEARALADADPFVACGAVGYALREWTVNEGAISISVSLSDSSVVVL